LTLSNAYRYQLAGNKPCATQEYFGQHYNMLTALSALRRALLTRQFVEDEFYAAGKNDAQLPLVRSISTNNKASILCPHLGIPVKLVAFSCVSCCQVATPGFRFLGSNIPFSIGNRPA